MELIKDWNGSSQLFHLLVKEGGLAPIPYVYAGPLKELHAHSQYDFSSKLGNDRLLWNDSNRKFSKLILNDIRKGTWRRYNPSTGNKTLNHEYMILRDKLIIYEKHCKQLDIIPEDTYSIIKNNLLLGPEYSVYRKKVFDYSIRELVSKTRVQTPEEVKTQDLKEGINKFFPSRHMMNWELPINYSDIMDYSFEVPHITTKLSALEERMEKFLKKNQILRKFDILDSFKESNSKVGFSKGKKGKTCDIRQKGNPIDVETEYLRFKISWTTKNPDEGRLIAISETLTRNLCSIAREATATINNCPWDVYGKPTWNFIKFLNKKHDRFFILCDQSKSGWTFPMELMASYFKICAIVYPEYEYFKILENIFHHKRIIYDIEDQEYSPLRGFILGMWDNVQSFIISCIFDLFVEKELKTQLDFQDLKFNAMFWGDDQIIRLDNCSNLVEIQVWNKWMYYMTIHGIYVNKKKSFVSDVGIFCEVYTQNSVYNLEKSLIYILGILNSLRGCCTFERKVFWSLYDDQMRRVTPYFSERCQTAINDLYFTVASSIQQIIGFEFNSFEKYLPVQFGGWLQLRDEDNNPQLLDFLWNKFDSILKGFVNVGYNNPTFSRFDKPSKGYKKWKEDPFIKDILTCLDQDFLFYDLKTSLKNKFKALHLGEKLSKNKIHKFWIKAQAKRQLYFSQKTTYTQQNVLYKFFSEGLLKDPMKIDYLVKRSNNYGFIPLKQQSHKFKVNFSSERVVLYLQQRLGLRDFGIKFINENKISFKEVVANCYKTISSTNYIIPTEWYVWCLRSGTNPDRLYQAFYEKYLENIFHYFPPLSLKDDKVFKKMGFLENHFLYWDEHYGCPFQISEEEVIILDSSDPIQRIKMFSEKLALTYEDFMERAELRSFEHKDQEASEFIDELQEINELIQERSVSDLVNKPMSDFIDQEEDIIISNVNDIEDYDTESDFEARASEHDSDDDDPLARELRRLGLDTVDLTDYGNVEEYYDEDE